MNTNQSASPASLIKAATSAAHLNTEKLLVRYVKQVQSNRDYAAILACMHGYFAPLEQKLDAQMKALLPDHEQRRKAGNMEKDLAVLLEDVKRTEAVDLPDTGSDAAALGCFYVMEGSTLGGTVITKVIKDKNPGIPENAFSFFSGYGADNMNMWQAFVARFNELLVSDEQVAIATAAANDCFAKLENRIREYYNEVRE